MTIDDFLVLTQKELLVYIAKQAGDALNYENGTEQAAWSSSRTKQGQRLVEIEKAICVLRYYEHKDAI